MFGNWRKKSSSPASNLRHDEIVHAMHIVANDDTAEHRAQLFRLFRASDFVVIVDGRGQMLQLAHEHEQVVPSHLVAR